MNSPGWQMPNVLLDISGEITPERMKWLGQSGEELRCGCESKEKVKLDAVKNNIAQDPRMSGP